LLIGSYLETRLLTWINLREIRIITIKSISLNHCALGDDLKIKINMSSNITIELVIST